MYCPDCKNFNAPEAVRCSNCGKALRAVAPKKHKSDTDPDVKLPERSGLPGRNPFAIPGYYCGVFGLIPFFGFLLGPIAIVLGTLGLRRAGEVRGKGTYHSWTAIVLGVAGLIFSIVVVILERQGVLTFDKVWDMLQGHEVPKP